MRLSYLSFFLTSKVHSNEKKNRSMKQGIWSFHLRFIILPELPYTSACQFVFHQTGLYPVKILFKKHKTSVCVCMLFSHVFNRFFYWQRIDNRALPLDLEFNKTIKQYRCPMDNVHMCPWIEQYYNILFIYLNNFLIKLFFLILFILARSIG